MRCARGWRLYCRKREVWGSCETSTSLFARHVWLGCRLQERRHVCCPAGSCWPDELPIAFQNNNTIDKVWSVLKLRKWSQRASSLSSCYRRCSMQLQPGRSLVEYSCSWRLWLARLMCAEASRVGITTSSKTNIQKGSQPPHQQHRPSRTRASRLYLLGGPCLYSLGGPCLYNQHCRQPPSPDCQCGTSSSSYSSCIRSAHCHKEVTHFRRELSAPPAPTATAAFALLARPVVVAVGVGSPLVLPAHTHTQHTHTEAHARSRKHSRWVCCA